MRFLVFLTLLFFIPAQVLAFPLIRDTEIEETLRLYTNPVLEAAGLNPEDVDIILINDKRLNAFVANGQRIHVFAGLLMEAETPEEVIGVMAHETGHILGGHLARAYEQIDNLKATSYISLILGAAAAVLAKTPEATTAVLAGSQQVQVRTFLTHSRAQEQAADQASVELLDKVGVSSTGLKNFMKTLEGKSLLISNDRDPYVMTHPAIPDRIAFIEHHAKHSPHADRKLDPEMYERHARMRAKLDGFLNEPVQTLRKYSPGDTSIPARYARAIAFYQQSDLEEALRLIEGLLAEKPTDPYFMELKGQMLFEFGRIEDSIAAYRQSVKEKPDAPLLQVGLAQSLLAREGEKDRESANEALNLLQNALRKDKGNALAWRLKSVAHGKRGEIGMANLALAEYFLLINDQDDARQKARIAQKQLEENSPGWFRASDILNQAEVEKG